MAPTGEQSVDWKLTERFYEWNRFENFASESWSKSFWLCPNRAFEEYDAVVSLCSWHVMYPGQAIATFVNHKIKF